MSKVKVQVDHLPSITTYRIDAYQMRRNLENCGIKWTYLKLDDSWYFYVSWEDWGKIFNHVQAKLPTYKSDKMDCDNFGDLIKVRVAELFGVNTCARVDGYWKGLRHAWNVFYDGENFYQLESQKAGDLRDLIDDEYKPDMIFMG